MATKKQKIAHDGSRSCGCEDCQNKLDQLTLMNRTKMWFNSQLPNLSKNLPDILKERLASLTRLSGRSEDPPAPKAKPAKKRPTRRKKT